MKKYIIGTFAGVVVTFAALVAKSLQEDMRNRQLPEE